MFNVSAIRRLRHQYNLSSPAATSGKEEDDDVASILAAPGMDTNKLWKETAHQKKLVIKEV
jgi:hypothetical protein